MSRARDKTLLHLRRLLLLGVPMGVAEAQEPTDAGPTEGEGEWHMKHADPDAGMNTGNMGYGVVDPMPPPSRGCGCRKSDPYE